MQIFQVIITKYSDVITVRIQSVNCLFKRRKGKYNTGQYGVRGNIPIPSISQMASQKKNLKITIL